MTQKTAFEMLRLGYNMLITGTPGSGKTHLLNKFIKHLKKYKVPTGITATTGIAATHIGGVTLDSWSGIGISEQLTDVEIFEITQKKYLKDRLLHTKVLIIDEVSMLSSGKVDLLNRVLQAARRNQNPFGAVQMVFCGDFFQLPPVSDNRNNPPYAFKSKVWNVMDLHVAYLAESHRQEDGDFLHVLTSIRENKVSDLEYKILRVCVGREFPRGVVPARLYTHNIDVDEINKRELDKINSDTFSFEMESAGIPSLAESLKKSCLAPSSLELKKGAVVMFVRNNVREGFVNGTMGKVIRLNETGPIVETFDKRKIHVAKMTWSIEEDGRTKASVTQFPLRLAWAITVHKSQGMTLSAAEVDLSKSFLLGMGYVALSRLRNLEGLKILGLNQVALSVSPEIVGLDRFMREKSKEEEKELANLGVITRFFRKRNVMYRLTS